MVEITDFAGNKVSRRDPKAVGFHTKRTKNTKGTKYTFLFFVSLPSLFALCETLLIEAQLENI